MDGVNGPAACDPDKKQAAHIGNTNVSGKGQAKTNTMNGQRKEKANGVSSMHNQVWRYYNKTGAFVNQKAAHAIINYISGFALFCRA